MNTRALSDLSDLTHTIAVILLINLHGINHHKLMYYNPCSGIQVDACSSLADQCFQIVDKAHAEHMELRSLDDSSAETYHLPSY